MHEFFLAGHNGLIVSGPCCWLASRSHFPYLFTLLSFEQSVAHLLLSIDHSQHEKRWEYLSCKKHSNQTPDLNIYFLSPISLWQLFEGVASYPWFHSRVILPSRECLAMSEGILVVKTREGDAIVSKDQRCYFSSYIQSTGQLLTTRNH